MPQPRELLPQDGTSCFLTKHLLRLASDQLAKSTETFDALSYDYGLNPFISKPGGCSLAALQLNLLQCPQGTDLKREGSQMVPVFRKEGRHRNLLCHTPVSFSVAADLGSSFVAHWRPGGTSTRAGPAWKCHHAASQHDPPRQSQAPARVIAASYSYAASQDGDGKGNHLHPLCPWDAVSGLCLPNEA